jgi:hypothetical protein
MNEWPDDQAGDGDLRYTCPKCKRVFTKPTEGWVCPTCKETLRILGALRLRDRRRNPGFSGSSDDTFA